MRKTALLSLLCATACAASSCTDPQAPTPTSPAATASSPALATLSADGCLFEISDAWSGITTITDHRIPHLEAYHKSYPIAEQGNPRLRSWLVFHGRISCAGETTVDAERFSALRLTQTQEAMQATEEEKKTYPDSLLLGNPRRVPKSPLSAPFKADVVPVSKPYSPPAAGSFWQIFPLAEGETPVSLLTGESSISVEGLLKPSPTTDWSLPPLDS